MDNSTNQTESAVELLQDQFDILLALLTRPVVQRQIAAALVILIIVWLLPEGVRRWRRGESAGEVAPTEVASGRQRWLVALYGLLTPVSALALFHIAIRLFAQKGYPNGLLADLTNLIWFWLAYRVLLTLLFARYGEAIRPYRSRILTPVLVFLVILQIANTIPGASALADLTITMGTVSITIVSLAAALVVFYLFAVAAWVIKKIVNQALPSRLKAETGAIESIAALARYTVLAIGIILSLGIVGIDFASLAIVAGGLSVGIGIGLQDIVSNLVSGLVLLFEQSLRPGDAVEVGGWIGQVEGISLRATMIRTRTNEELIIPNAAFTQGQVINLNKTDRLVRVVVPFGVSHDSDPESVRQMAVETGLRHPVVLADPAPWLQFLGYSDSSIDFELTVRITRPDLAHIVKSDLYYMLWNAFAEHRVVIPFPEQDLNLGDGWEKLTKVHR